MKTLVGFIGALTGGAVWTGKLHQRINGHDAMFKTISERLASLDETAKETERSLGRIEGRLDVLLSDRDPGRA